MTYPKPRSVLAQIPEYKPGKSLKEAAADVGHNKLIKLASNENPFGAAISLSELENAYTELHYYPHAETSGLIDKLAELWRVNKQQIILGNGSDEVISLSALAYLNPGENIVTSKETFSVYQSVATMYDGRVKHIPLKNGYVDVDGLIEVCDESTKLLFIANPNNPTATLIPNNVLADSLSKIPKHILVVIDEAYGEFVSLPGHRSAVSLIPRMKNLLVLRTFSKCYGLAGLRIGYGIGSESVISELKKVRPPFNVNSFALAAATIALDKHDFVEKTLNNNVKEKQVLEKGLHDLGLRFFASEANFICFESPIDADSLIKELLEKGYIVRSLSSFFMPNHIRVTIGKPDDNAGFLLALKQCLKRG